jgi:hypothetical protein
LKGNVKLPAEIIQCNSRVAEVRLICDFCGAMIGIRLMPIKEAESQIKNRIVCEECKQTKK